MIFKALKAFKFFAVASRLIFFHQKISINYSALVFGSTLVSDLIFFGRSCTN